MGSLQGVQGGIGANTWKVFDVTWRCAANGAVTQPDVGTGYSRARWCDLGSGSNLILAQYHMQPLTASSAGSGSCYVLNLPRPANRWTESPIVIGWGLNYHAITGDAYNNPVVCTLADRWTSLGGEADSCFQMYQPYSLAKGTATIPNSASSVTVNHGMGYAPAAYDIEVTGTSASPAANQYFPWWITNITSTQFTINVRTSMSAAQTMTFSWKIRSEPQSSTSGSWLVGPTSPWPVVTNQAYFMQVYYEAI